MEIKLSSNPEYHPICQNVKIQLILNEKNIPQITNSPRVISSIASNNELAPTRRQAIIWTNDG